MCVRERERERERECVCEREKERECVCVCVCVRETVSRIYKYNELIQAKLHAFVPMARGSPFTTKYRGKCTVVCKLFLLLVSLGPVLSYLYVALLHS